MILFTGGAIPACIAGSIPTCLAAGLQGVTGPGGCAWSQGRVCSWGGAWSWGGLLLGGAWSRGVPGLRGAWSQGVPGGDPPGAATAADGTHPTGMHSCFFYKIQLEISVQSTTIGYSKPFPFLQLSLSLLKT